MALLYVDRSRYVAGLAHCMMKRFLGYHAYGTGIQHVGTTVPLATGTYVHLPIEDISNFVMDVQQNSPEMVPLDIMSLMDEKLIVRSAIEKANNLYIEEVDQTGLKDLTEFPEDVDNQVVEQTSLVGGLVWVWVKKCLPWILESYDIIAVEQEFEYVISCTCGLGDVGDVADHDARGCDGVVLMTRPDLILRHRMTGILVYVELKTGADVKNYNYAMQYEDNVQFALGAAAAGKVLGEPIEELYVHALHKGRRVCRLQPIHTCIRWTEASELSILLRLLQGRPAASDARRSPSGLLEQGSSHWWTLGRDREEGLPEATNVGDSVHRASALTFPTMSTSSTFSKVSTETSSRTI